MGFTSHVYVHYHESLNVYQLDCIWLNYVAGKATRLALPEETVIVSINEFVNVIK